MLRPMGPSLALDFLAMIDARERLPGGSYVSQRWTVPAGAPGWTRPAASDVASARVDGDQVSIADADGGAWIVGVGQPFVFAGAPGTVLRIDRDGAVCSLSLAQATAARRSLGR
jgi:hypothetical protein